jgi:hypothetical protein
MKSEEFTGRSPAMKKEGPWLSSEELMDAGEVTVEIEKVFRHVDAEFDEGRKETVHALKFVGKERQLVLNNTNRKTLVAKFQTTDVKQWIGKPVTLFVVHGIRKPGGKKGETTCGIRVK